MPVPENMTDKSPRFSTGFGFDVHRFVPLGKDFILGGVKIPFSMGVEAVSDGDVVLHAVCDGILGAACLGDIGDYFPPEKESSADLSSIEIVKFVMKKIEKKYLLGNIDITVILDKPRLSAYKEEIVRSLKEVFRIDNINFKIKSKENLDILGGKESIVCMASVMLIRC